MTVTTLLNGSSVGLIHNCVEHTFFENAKAIITPAIHELADQLFKANERVRFEHIFPVELKGIIPQILDDLFSEATIITTSTNAYSFSSVVIIFFGVEYEISCSDEEGSETLIFGRGHAHVTLEDFTINGFTELAPRDIGIKNMIIRKTMAFEGILNQAHIPAALEGCIQSENILVGSIHGANDGHVRGNPYQAIRVTINYGSDIFIGYTIFTGTNGITACIWLSLSVKKLEYLTKDSRSVTAVYFFNN